MSAKFAVPSTASAQPRDEKELDLGLQALSVVDDARPRSPQEWIPFLHGKYRSATSNVDRARIGRALAQLVITVSYDNADLFVAREPDAAPPVTFAIDDDLREARIQYKFGGVGATPTQTLTYMCCLASLVKRGFALEDMRLPNPASQLAALFLGEAAAAAAPEGSGPARFDRGLCASAAKHFRRVGSLLSVADAHSFLAIWLFVVLTLYSKFDVNDWLCVAPPDELIPVTSILRAAGYTGIADFVARAA